MRNSTWLQKCWWAFVLTCFVLAFQNCEQFDKVAASPAHMLEMKDDSGGGNGDTYAGFAPGSYLHIQEDAGSFEINSGLESQNGNYYFREANSNVRTPVNASDLVFQSNYAMYNHMLFQLYPQVPDVSSIVSVEDTFCWAGISGLLRDPMLALLFMNISIYSDGHRSADLEVPNAASLIPSIFEFDVSRQDAGSVATYSGSGPFGQSQMQVDTSQLDLLNGGYQAQITVTPIAGAPIQYSAFCLLGQ